MVKKKMLDIYTDMDSLMSQEQKDATSFDGNKSFQPTEGSVYRHPKNQSEKMMWQARPFCLNSISATQNYFQYLVWPPRACMHA